jgi:hypothetical protein
MKVEIQRGQRWIDPESITSRLGHKSQPYYETELEMLIKKTYDYDSLSISEKIIYNQKKWDHDKQ